MITLQRNANQPSQLNERKWGIVLYCKQTALNSEVMKEVLFKMMAIHPRFMVVDVHKHISLIFAPFNQPLGVQLQHPSLLNNPLLNKVPPYTIPNILVYHPMSI
jgi:hypothetical protein